MCLHIKTRIHKEGQNFQAGYYSIRLSKVMDLWAGYVREAVEHELLVITNPQIFYEHSQVMIQLPDKGLIYGDISERVIFEIYIYIYGNNDIIPDGGKRGGQKIYFKRSI